MCLFSLWVKMRLKDLQIMLKKKMFKVFFSTKVNKVEPVKDIMDGIFPFLEVTV